MAGASTQLENAATVLQPSSKPVTITQLKLLFDGDRKRLLEHPVRHQRKHTNLDPDLRHPRRREGLC